MGLLTQIDEKLQRWRGERTAAEGVSEPSGGTDWAALVPQLLGAALLAATLVLVVLRYSALGAPSVVVFDVIKYANSQRAVASKFVIGKDAVDEAAPLLLDVSQRTRDVIREVAGANTLVVIRQAVVQGEMRDITDEVLERLGMPVDVPTTDPTKYVLDIAPTMLGTGPRLDAITVSPRPAPKEEDVLP